MRRPTVFAMTSWGCTCCHALGSAACVQHSGLKKAQQEKRRNNYGAKDIAKFLSERARLSAGQEHMTKPGTIHTCLTVYNRLLNIPQYERANPSMARMARGARSGAFKRSSLVVARSPK